MPSRATTSLRREVGGRAARHDARAVLRPRLRLRDHAGLAPAARRPDAGRAPAQAALVLLVVWWSWNYTTWVTNELDPDSIVVRLLLIGLMLASLLMAIAIPDAFGERGAAVRRLVRRHPGRAPPVPDLRRRRRRHDRARARRRASSSGSSPPACSGSRARSPTATRARCSGWRRSAIDYARAAGHVLGARARRGSTPDAWEVGTGALRRALPAVHHHRARRDDRDHRRDDRRARARHRARWPRSRSRSSSPRRSGGSTSTTSRRSPSAGSQRRGEPHACWRATPTPTSTS